MPTQNAPRARPVDLFDAAVAIETRRVLSVERLASQEVVIAGAMLHNMAPEMLTSPRGMPPAAAREY